MTKDTLIPATPSQEEYSVAADQGNVFTSDDPIALFETWLALAGRHEMNDPNAMSLATASNDVPDVRVVLLKDVSARGFSFYSHVISAKGQDMTTNPMAALCFHWKSIRRQVRVRGVVTHLSSAESDAYFASRSRGSKIGAWASEQSKDLPSAATLTDRIAHFEEKFPDDVPRPENWYGFLVAPRAIEFWVNRPFRLHDRLLFEKAGDGWASKRLYP